jgi:hypothetical protein
MTARCGGTLGIPAASVPAPLCHSSFRFMERNLAIFPLDWREAHADMIAGLMHPFSSKSLCRVKESLRTLVWVFHRTRGLYPPHWRGWNFRSSG